MRILFITSNRLGDAVISTGVLDALQRRYPAATFTIVCGPVAAGLFEALPRCERIIVMEKRRGDRHWFDLWRSCARIRWFMIVDLRGSLLGLCLRSRRRVIVRGGRRSGLRLDRLSRALGYRRRLLPRAWSLAEQTASAAQLLPSGQKYLALAPTANWDGKIWAAEKFVAVAQLLQNEGFVPVLFYGPGEDERRRAQPVLQRLENAFDFGGGRSLGEVAALLGRCALFVGNDSGLMHLAAATGAPTLGLFGPSRVSEYAPSGVLVDAVVAPGAEGKGDMSDISVEAVIAGVRRLLARQDSRTSTGPT